MAVAILQYGQPKHQLARLARVPLTQMMRFWGSELKPGDNRCLGDLQEEDHLVMIASSRALTANFYGLKCRVSLVMAEPRAIQGRYYRWIRILSRRFYAVFTYDEFLLRKLSNSRRCEHGCRSIVIDGSLPPKSKNVSLLASAKRTTTGHQMRHSIAHWSRQSGVPLDLWGTGFGPRCSLNDALEPYRFSVVIENSKQPGYFTEKLIDCLACQTVPIYWGDPTIGKTFDLRGMISCEGPEQIKDAIQSCNDSLYENMLPFLEENVRRSRQFESMMVIRAAEQLQAECQPN